MKKTITFEQAMARLDEIVAVLDDGKSPLEQSLKLFSEGAELIAFCNDKLGDAALTIEKLFPAKDQEESQDGQL